MNQKKMQIKSNKKNNVEYYNMSVRRLKCAA